jgi:outer membrane protein assembly factor BamE
MIYFLFFPENDSPSGSIVSLPRHLMRPHFLLAALAVVGLSSGCSFNALTDSVNPYRVEVRQGNYVDQTMISQLRKGMTREQVRFVLGTPLVIDPFRDDRWDYVYAHRPSRGKGESKVLSVFFVDNLLDHVTGDVVAGDSAADATEPVAERSRVVEVLRP